MKQLDLERSPNFNRHLIKDDIHKANTHIKILHIICHQGKAIYNKNEISLYTYQNG